MDDQFFDNGDGESEEAGSWWTMQAWTLAAGLGCGFLAHVATRMLTTRSAMSLPTEKISTTSTQRMCSSVPFSFDNKMVFIVRTDIGMGKGKAAAQCAHAAVELYKCAMKRTPELMRRCEAFGQARVVLKAPVGSGSETALYELQQKADRLGLASVVIRDAGRTQLEPGTVTVLGIGPGPVQTIDDISGHLKLY